MQSSLCEAYHLTWVKLNVRPEVSTEPTHSLTLMNNGNFLVLQPVSVSTRTLTSQGIGFLETLKNLANLFKIYFN